MISESGLRRLLYGAGVLACLIAATCYFRPIEVASLQARINLRLQGEHGHYVVVAGNRIHYREMGSGPPLVLIHGLGGSSLDWAPVMPRYAKAGYHVYAPDLLGFGKSDQPDIVYSMADQARMLQQFFTAEHIAHADVIGWSMGGWVALKFTLDNPELVRRLVVNDSAGLKFNVGFTANVFTPVTRDDVNTLFSLMEPKIPPIPQFIAQDLIRRVRSRHGWVINQAMETMMTGTELLDGRLTAIKQPVLIVWGADDKLIPVSSGYEMAREMPQADLEIFSGCGHLAPARCAHAVTDRTLQFLQAAQPPHGVAEQVAGS